jgi:hypothetical protein
MDRFFQNIISYLFYKGGRGKGAPGPYTFTSNEGLPFLVESKIKSHYSKESNETL